MTTFTTGVAAAAIKMLPRSVQENIFVIFEYIFLGVDVIFLIFLVREFWRVFLRVEPSSPFDVPREDGRLETKVPEKWFTLAFNSTFFALFFYIFVNLSLGVDEFRLLAQEIAAFSLFGFLYYAMLIVERIRH